MTSRKKHALHLFEAYGVELEYMIVNRDTLDVMPVADELLRLLARKPQGQYVNDVTADGMGMANEFVKHVVELRNEKPSPSFDGLHALYQREVERMNRELAPLGAKLLPGSMHPWMDPAKQSVLWDHDNREIYETYDRIFGCRRHGWANIQSMQLNLPFSGDLEFERLHAAVRIVLPMIPALTASSPVTEGALCGLLDCRIPHYRTNQSRVPAITGNLIPDPVFSIDQYHRDVLGTIRREMEGLDPEGVITHEWLNSRAAIARFDRSAIEIRLADIQECPLMDMAAASLIATAVDLLVDERFCLLDAQHAWSTERLNGLLEAALRDGQRTVIEDLDYVDMFGLRRRKSTARDIWSRVAEHASTREPRLLRAMGALIQEGTLAARIIKKLGRTAQPSRQRLHTVWEELSLCLAEGRMFGV